MTPGISLRQLADQFSNVASRLESAGKVVDDAIGLRIDQRALAAKTFRKQPERQAELLAAADAKFAVALDVGNTGIDEARAAVAALRDAQPSYDGAVVIADAVELQIKSTLARALESQPDLPPGEAIARQLAPRYEYVSGDSVTVIRSVSHSALPNAFKNAAAKLEAEHIMRHGVA